jgi:hypothetical protein
MTKHLIFSATIAALMAVPGLAAAQDKNMHRDASGQPPTKQSAPANAQETSGHDAQTGAPKTGEPKPGVGETRGEAQPKDGQSSTSTR